MKQLFLENFFFSFYVVTWLISIITYKKYFDTPLRFFPIFIAYVIFTELLGYFILKYEEFSFFSEPEYAWHNIVIYNIYGLIMLYFFYSLYFKTLKSQKFKRIFVALIIFTALAYVISLFFQDPLHSTLYYADFVASYTLITVIIFYLIEKKKEGKLPILTHSLLFWVSMGLLFFHPIFPVLYFVGFEYPDIWIEYHFRKILWVCISVMYALFSIGLILGRRKAFR